jgi:hypothetical protein
MPRSAIIAATSVAGSTGGDFAVMAMSEEVARDALDDDTKKSTRRG